MVRMAVLLAGLLLGCTDSLDIGSDVLWSAGHEDATLVEWTDDQSGQSYAVGSESSVEVIPDPTERSRHLVRLHASVGEETDTGAGLWRILTQPEPAYYAARFYLPEPLSPSTMVTVLRFRSTAPEEVGDEFMGVDLALRTTPTGEHLLTLIHQRQAYLTSALPEPTPYVPSQQWFHLEVRFHHALDAAGLIRVWLDGRLVYDVAGRVTAETDQLYFTPCDVLPSTAPSPVTVYVDDVVIGRSRITPEGAPDD